MKFKFIMRKLLFLSLGLLLTLMSCNEGKTHGDLVVDAEITGVKDGAEVYLAEMGKGNRPISLDTAEVKNGKVILNLPKVDFQTLNVMTINGANGNLLFINENEPIEVKVDAENLRDAEIKGGKANTLFTEYQELMAKGNKKMMNATDGMDQEEFQSAETQQQLRELQAQIEEENTKFRKKAIEENPEELTSILIFTDMMRTQMVPQPEMKKLYDGLSKQVQETYIGKEIGKELNASKGVAVGSKAPSFSAPTPDGEELALEDALGKYTLVDFWAAWCMPCRKENPNIVKVYEEYHDKGFNVLGVSLDKDRDKWLKAIEDDGLEWAQISNLKFWNDPIAKEYGIRAIPQSYLLDENGKIVAQNLRGPALGKKIKELLEEE